MSKSIAPADGSAQYVPIWWIDDDLDPVVESWHLDGFEDVPVPKWNDDDLEEAHQRLRARHDPELDWHITPCTDDLGHAFNRGADRYVMAQALCGKYVFPADEKQDILSFCHDCVLRKSPN